MQMLLLWCCQKPAFGIHPSRPLRILVIQSEDDDNDIIEMSRMINRLGLSRDEITLVQLNSHIEWVNDVGTAQFFADLESFLIQFPCDLLIINPYSAYQPEVIDEKSNNDFLRVNLSRLMTLYDFGVLLVHHTPKTHFQKLDAFNWWDFMYGMAGGASLTNWSRGILFIQPSELVGTYRFIAAKRFEKTGWPEREIYFSHSLQSDSPLWVPSSKNQIAAIKKPKELEPEDLLDIYPVVDGITIAEFQLAASKRNVGVNRARNFHNILLERHKILMHSTARNGTNALKTFTKV